MHVSMNVILAAHRAPPPLWAGFDDLILILAWPLTLLRLAHQLLPEDHTDLVEVKVQQKMDSLSASSASLRRITRY